MSKNKSSINTKKLRRYLKWFEKNVAPNQFHFNYFRRPAEDVALIEPEEEMQQLYASNTCGTVGCVIGHITDYDKYLIHKDAVGRHGLNEDDYKQIAYDRFGMTERHFNVFLPAYQTYVHGSLPNMRHNSSKAEVLDMLHKFCDLVDQGQIS